MWIAVSTVDAVAVHSNGTKILLVNGVSTFFDNGKPTLIKAQRRLLSNSPFWLKFLAVTLNKISLFSYDLITFLISFILLLVSVIPELISYESFLLSFLRKNPAI